MLHAVWNAEHIHQRLSELAEDDPQMRRFGARRHRYRLAPVVTEPDLARFEAAHGITLPASYRLFLTTVGDGGAGPYYGLFRHDGADWPGYLQQHEQRQKPLLGTAFAHTTAFQPWPDVKPCGQHPDPEDSFDPCWLAGTLILAEFGCGANYRLVVTGPARGQVWFDDLANDQGLTPGPDFRDWYLAWLENPPPPKTAITGITRGTP